MKSFALIVLVLVVSAGSVIGTALAYSEADLQELKRTGSCVKCDLSGAVLIHWNLSGADLSEANLTSANLTDAYLAGANLFRANLSKAILTSTNLAGANLLHAKLEGANLLFANIARATWTDGSQCERSSSGHCRR
jgi:uncharacterized protein YjbI with pentapeptide repeats